VRASRFARFSAARAELVVEDVDVLVRLLAHVAALRLRQPTSERARRRTGPDVDASRLVVDTRRSARRRRLDDRAVRLLDRRLRLVAALLLHRLVELRRRALQRHLVRVLGGQGVRRLEDLESARELVRVHARGHVVDGGGG